VVSNETDDLFMSVPIPDQSVPTVPMEANNEWFASSSEMVLPRRNPPRNCGPPNRLRF